MIPFHIFGRQWLCLLLVLPSPRVVGHWWHGGVTWQGFAIISFNLLSQATPCETNTLQIVLALQTQLWEGFCSFLPIACPYLDWTAAPSPPFRRSRCSPLPATILNAVSRCITGAIIWNAAPCQSVAVSKYPQISTIRGTVWCSRKNMDIGVRQTWLQICLWVTLNFCFCKVGLRGLKVM